MWKDLKKRLPDVDREELLDLIGLERSRSTGDKLVPALALFGAGVLVGVGLGLMLAPRPGRELRHDLRARLTPDDGRKTPAPAPKPAETLRPA
jgi:hypothetical protein